MTLGERERPDGCITDLRFDAWVAGELEMDAYALQSHLDACARCRERHASLLSTRDAYLARHPRAELRVARRAPARSLRWSMPVALVGAGALLAVLFAPPAMEPIERTRRKGGASIGFFVERAGVFERGRAGQGVQPGDRVRFAYTSERPAYVAILSRDAAGTVSVYFPSGALASYVSEGYDRPLESAVALDATLGPERVFALFCEDSFAVAEPRSALTASQTLVPTEGCQVATLSWTKERVP